MAESLSLSLQALPIVNNGKKSLEYLIERINEQKGSFRNVTEESLGEEIQILHNGEAETSEDDVFETVEDVEDLKSKREAITAGREEILKQVLLVTYPVASKRHQNLRHLVRPTPKALKPLTLCPYSSRNTLPANPKRLCLLSSSRTFLWAHWVGRSPKRPKCRKLKSEMQSWRRLGGE